MLCNLMTHWFLHIAAICHSDSAYSVIINWIIFVCYMGFCCSLWSQSSQIIEHVANDSILHSFNFISLDFEIKYLVISHMTSLATIVTVYIQWCHQKIEAMDRSSCFITMTTIFFLPCLCCIVHLSVQSSSPAKITWLSCHLCTLLSLSPLYHWLLGDRFSPPLGSTLNW